MSTMDDPRPRAARDHSPRLATSRPDHALGTTAGGLVEDRAETRHRVSQALAHAGRLHLLQQVHGAASSTRRGKASRRRGDRSDPASSWCRERRLPAILLVDPCADGWRCARGWRGPRRSRDRGPGAPSREWRRCACVRVALGPASPCCYEVAMTSARRLSRRRRLLRSRRVVVSPRLALANEAQLLARAFAGADRTIEDCTYCRPNLPLVPTRRP